MSSLNVLCVLKCENRPYRTLIMIAQVYTSLVGLSRCNSDAWKPERALAASAKSIAQMFYDVKSPGSPVVLYRVSQK